MKSPEGFTPPETEIEKVEKEITPKSPEGGVAEINQEQLQEYAASAELQIEQQAAEFLPESERRIESSSQSMGIYSEMLETTKQEQGLDAKLQEVQAEADDVASETKSEIEAVIEGTQLETDQADSKKSTLGFQRKSLSGMMQRARGKENIRYINHEGKEFFTKYVNQQEGKRDNIAGLKREKQILDKLADTGATPKAGELKTYPNEKRARLIIEQVPGVSLDRMDDKQSDEFLKESAESTIYSTADALDKVHQKGILLVDVNDGTFLLNKEDNETKTRLVDFELAVDLNDNATEDREAAFRWYSNKDIGLRLDEQLDHQNSDTLRRSEINLWARTLAERMIGFSDLSTTVDVPPDKKERFEVMKEKISPILEKEIIERAKKNYEYQSRIPKEERFYELPTEEDFVKKELERELPRKIEEELIGIPLEEKMKAKGITISKETIDFMSRALDPELKNRPSSFSELHGRPQLPSAK